MRAEQTTENPVADVVAEEDKEEEQTNRIGSDDGVTNGDPIRAKRYAGNKQCGDIQARVTRMRINRRDLSTPA